MFYVTTGAVKYRKLLFYKYKINTPGLPKFGKIDVFISNYKIKPYN